MVRFLHTADWQIGMTRHFLSPEAQPRFSAARTDVVRRLGQVAQEQGCAFVVVAGDVFEHDQLTPQTVRRALEALRAVPVSVLLLPGNHDHLGPMSIWSSALLGEELPDHVRVLDRAGVHEVAPKVEIVAAPWHGKHPTGDPVAEALAAVPDPAPDGVVRILVGHGGVDVLDRERRDAAAVQVAPLVRALDEGRVHYVALGDRHSVTQVAGDPAIWFAGAPEPTDWREERPGEVLVVDVAPRSAGEGGAGVAQLGLPLSEGQEGSRGVVRVKAVPVASWRFVTVDAPVDGDEDLDALDERLDGLQDKERTLVRLALRGTLGLAQHARLDGLLERHGQLLGALHRPARHQDVVLVDEGDLGDLGLGGFLASAAEQIRAEAFEPAGHARTDHSPEPAAFRAGLPDDEESARDALALLYRLTRGGAR